MNQENLNNTENVNNNIAQPVQPTYTQPVQPAYTQPAAPAAQPVQPAYTEPVAPAAQPVQPAYTEPVQPQQAPVNIEEAQSVEMISNLNKEDAMEEALSHTNQYTPFEVQQEEVNQEVSFMSNKKAIIFLGVIFAIMLAFIILLPQISNWIGW